MPTASVLAGLDDRDDLVDLVDLVDPVDLVDLVDPVDLVDLVDLGRTNPVPSTHGLTPRPRHTVRIVVTIGK